MSFSEIDSNIKRFEDLIKNSILSVIEDSVIATNMKGQIVFWNKGAEKMFGYTEKEVLGKTPALLYPDMSKEMLKVDLEKIISGEDYIGEWKGKRKSGEEVWLDVRTTVMKNKDGEVVGFIGVSKDITEKKQTVKELLESEIKYQAIFENSGEGLLLMTDQFIDCNKKLCELWECTKKDVIGKTPGEFSPKFQSDGSISADKAKQYVKSAFEEGIKSFYWQHLTKKGNKQETRITLSRIKIEGKLHLIAVVQDLSEIFKYQSKLKAKSKELLEQNEEIKQLNDELNDSNLRLKIINKQIDLSEKKFRAAFKTSPDAININRLKDGVYVEINEGFTHLTGFSEKDVLNKNPYTLNIWCDNKEREILLKDLKKDGFIDNREIQYQTKSGEINTGLISASIIEIEGVEYYISITRDISERKEYEEKLQEARKKAEESDMLKSAFLANMSHEIRTPMNAILGFGQLLREKELDREKQNKFLDIIVVRSKNLLQIINDIIDISKIEANQLKIEKYEFSLNKMLYELFSGFEAEIAAQNKKNVKLAFKAELRKDASYIESDEIRLRQILTNLISNAIKFTEKGKIEFGYSIKDQMLQFFISDTGIGIPPKAIKQIFERFRQADDSNTREFGGTGLGLSISKQLVEMLGGKIWVESILNKGSVFYFTIPFKPKEKEKRVANKTEEIVLDLADKHLLIVEDDNISMTYLEELLQPTNAQIIKAFDGVQAVEKFKTEKVDLILMDIHLPKMSGNEATQEIKRINNTVPIIAQSAFAMPNDKKESFKYGCDEYITKPIDTRLLFSTIKKFLI